MHLPDPNAVMNLVASILTLAAAAIPFLKKSESRRRECGKRVSKKTLAGTIVTTGALFKKSESGTANAGSRFQHSYAVLMLAAALAHDLGVAAALKKL